MKEQMELEPCLIEAICNIENYIFEITGEKATQEEIADALSKFFVLKEIREFIEMRRMENEG